MTAHVNYPHTPGYLYDCAACEERCHCTPGSAECVFEGEHTTPDPLHTTAFTTEQTGGGCTALVRYLINGTVLVLTDGNLGTDVYGEHAEPLACVYASRDAWEQGEDAVDVSGPWESCYAFVAARLS